MLIKRECVQRRPLFSGEEVWLSGSDLRSGMTLANSVRGAGPRGHSETIDAHVGPVVITIGHNNLDRSIFMTDVISNGLYMELGDSTCVILQLRVMFLTYSSQTVEDVNMIHLVQMLLQNSFSKVVVSSSGNLLLTILIRQPARHRTISYFLYELAGVQHKEPQGRTLASGIIAVYSTGMDRTGKDLGLRNHRVVQHKTFQQVHPTERSIATGFTGLYSTWLYNTGLPGRHLSPLNSQGCTAQDCTACGPQGRTSTSELPDLYSTSFTGKDLGLRVEVTGSLHRHEVGGQAGDRDLGRVP